MQFTLHGPFTFVGLFKQTLFTAQKTYVKLYIGENCQKSDSFTHVQVLAMSNSVGKTMR